jgi:hypothetical protein
LECVTPPSRTKLVDGVEVVYFNAQCISNKLDELRSLLDDCPQIGVVLIAETWLTDADKDDIFSRLNDFELIRCDRSGRKHGGVAILVKSKLNPKLLSSKSFNGFAEHLFIELQNNDYHVKIGVVYRSPSIRLGDDQELIASLRTELEKQGDVILVGDFNLPELYPELTVATGPPVLYNDLFSDFGLFQTVDSPTRGKNVLDLLLTNDLLLVSDVIVDVPFSTSDHDMLRFHVNVPSPDSESNYRPKPDFSKADFASMKDFLSTIDWENLLANQGVDEKWATYTDILSYAIHLFVPLSRPRTAAKHRKHAKSARKRKAQSKKKKLYKKYRAARSREVRDARYLKMKIAARELKEVERAETLEAETKVLHSNNNRTFFKFVNSKLTSKGRIPALFNKNGIKCEDAADKANALNEQFASVFTYDDGVSPPFPRRTDVSLDTVDVSPEKVLSVLKKLKPKPSRGPDGIPSVLLKNCAESLAGPLSTIFQASLDDGIVPGDWRTATIAPIYKRKGKTSDPANYRPVSPTSASCKVLETIIKDEIVSHMRSLGLLNRAQHGFLSKKSTATNLLTSLNKWYKAVDKGSVIHCAFLDFAKAFDTVSHPKLLLKLKSYGINGVLLNWISTWLHNRTQTVAVDGFESQACPVDSGVPQGTVLGPILFLIFVNDLAEVVHEDGCSIFADDTKIHAVCEKGTLTSPTLASSLQCVHEWAKTWQLSLSIPKCSVFCFGSSTADVSYSIDDTELPQVREIKDLGVFLSSCMKTSVHCTKVAKKALSMGSHIFRCFRTRKWEFLKAMFRVYVRPIVEYCSPVFSPYLLRDIRQIERVLRSYSKRIPGLRYLPYASRLKRLGLCSLEEGRIRADLILTFRILKGLTDLPREDFFEFSHLTATRGNSLKLKIPLARLDPSHHSFTRRVPAIWNALPDNVVTAPSIASFKSRLSKVDLRMYVRGSDTEAPEE